MYYSESEVEKAPSLRASLSYVMCTLKWFFNPLGLRQFFITLENVFALSSFIHTNKCTFSYNYVSVF